MDHRVEKKQWLWSGLWSELGFSESMLSDLWLKKKKKITIDVMELSILVAFSQINEDFSIQERTNNIFPHLLYLFIWNNIFIIFHEIISINRSDKLFFNILSSISRLIWAKIKDKNLLFKADFPNHWNHFSSLHSRKLRFKQILSSNVSFNVKWLGSIAYKGEREQM